jgi:hypothetical protein
MNDRKKCSLTEIDRQTLCTVHRDVTKITECKMSIEKGPRMVHNNLEHIVTDENFSHFESGLFLCPPEHIWMCYMFSKFISLLVK